MLHFSTDATRPLLLLPILPDFLFRKNSISLLLLSASAPVFDDVLLDASCCMYCDASGADLAVDAGDPLLGRDEICCLTCGEGFCTPPDRGERNIGVGINGAELCRATWVAGFSVEAG